MRTWSDIPEGWQDTLLGNCLKAIEGGESVVAEKCTAPDGEWRILKTSAITTGVYLPSKNKALSDAIAANLSVTPKADCILINRKNTPELVGTSAYVENDDLKTFIPDLIWQLHVHNKEQYYPKWLYFILSTKVIQSEIRRKANGTAESMVNVTKPSLFSVRIPCPPFLEQKRISLFLNCWERAITLTEKLLAEKQLRHKGLMQQLLTGKKRLPGFGAPLKRLELNALLSPIQRQVEKPKQPYDALGIRSHFKGTFAKQVDDPEKVGMDVLYRAKAGDLIVNITFAWEGAIAIVPAEHDERLVSHRFPMYRPIEGKILTKYLRYLVSRERFKYQLTGISPGGAGRNRVMSKKDFLKLEVSIPDTDEQEKTAEILDTASQEIGLLEEKIAALREQKKGLMQQLLTGKRRVMFASTSEQMGG